MDAETCSVDAEDSSATRLDLVIPSCMLVALAVICWAPAAICSIRAVMSSTAWPIVRNASRVCSTTATPSCGALGAVLHDIDGLAGLILDRADQLRDLVRGVLGLLGELSDLISDDREAAALIARLGLPRSRR